MSVRYEACKKEAQARSQLAGGVVDDTLMLDVHAISDLQKREVPVTNDSFKYAYERDANGKYTFESVAARVLAIRKAKEFAQEAHSGDECAVVFDRTCFYAEQGGQIYDEGFAVGSNDSEFVIKNVQVRAGYVGKSSSRKSSFSGSFKKVTFPFFQNQFMLERWQLVELQLAMSCV